MTPDTVPLHLPSPPPSESSSPLSSSSDSSAPPLSDLPSGSLSLSAGEGEDADYDMMASRDWGSSPAASFSDSSTSERSAASSDDRLRLSFPDPNALDDDDDEPAEAYSFLLEDDDSTPRASRTVYRVGDIHDWVQTTVSEGEMDHRVERAWEGARELDYGPSPPSELTLEEAPTPRVEPIAEGAQVEQQEDSPPNVVDYHLESPSSLPIPRRLVVLAALLVALATATSFAPSFTAYPSCTSLHPSFTTSADLAPCLASPAPSPSTAVSSARTALATIAPSPCTHGACALALVFSEKRNSLSFLAHEFSASVRSINASLEPVRAETDSYVAQARSRTMSARRTLRQMGESSIVLKGRKQLERRIPDLAALVQRVRSSLPRLPATFPRLADLPTFPSLEDVSVLKLHLRHLSFAFPQSFSTHLTLPELPHLALPDAHLALHATTRQVHKARKGLRHLLRGEIALDWDRRALVARPCVEVAERHQAACVAERGR